MAERLQFLDGPDGHGYNFPGPIAEIQAINPAAIALTHWEAMAVQPDGNRLSELELIEDVSIHSGDPASLTASINGATTEVFFLQDVRGRQVSPFHVPVGVTEYLVEWAPQEIGPWTLLQTVPDEGSYFYLVQDNVVEPTALMVRSLLILLISIRHCGAGPPLSPRRRDTRRSPRHAPAECSAQTAFPLRPRSTSSGQPSTFSPLARPLCYRPTNLVPSFISCTTV